MLCVHDDVREVVVELDGPLEERVGQPQATESLRQRRHVARTVRIALTLR